MCLCVRETQLPRCRQRGEKGHRSGERERRVGWGRREREGEGEALGKESPSSEEKREKERFSKEEREREMVCVRANGMFKASALTNQPIGQ